MTVTICGALTAVGATYRPLELIVPTAGEIDQVTDLLDVPATVAVNCCDWPAFSLAVGGVMVTLMIGTRVRIAFAVALDIAILVATTSTVCGVSSTLGAV
jgi:hypothetical protein